MYRDAKILDIGEREYRALPALCQTDMRLILQAPCRYAWRRTHPLVPTDRMALGTLVHALVLTPETAADTVAVLDYPDRRTKAYREDADAATADGRTPILIADYQEAERIASAVLTAAGPILAGRHEVAVVATHGETGTLVKGRLDGLGDGWAVELKTTADASKDAFARSVRTYGYHWQDAHYGALAGALIGVESLRVVFVAVETEPPYHVGIYEIDDGSRMRARGRVADAIRAFRLYEGIGWPENFTGRGPEIITLPEWA